MKNIGHVHPILENIGIFFSLLFFKIKVLGIKNSAPPNIIFLLACHLNFRSIYLKLSGRGMYTFYEMEA